MTAPNPKVVDAVTVALVEWLEAAPSTFIVDLEDGDFQIDAFVNLPALVADMVAVGQTPVDRVLAARKQRDAIKYPDREALAFTLFATDNRNAPPEVIRADYDRLRAEQAAAGETFYCDPLADAAIEAFRLANS